MNLRITNDDLGMKGCGAGGGGVAGASGVAEVAGAGASGMGTGTGAGAEAPKLEIPKEAVRHWVRESDYPVFCGWWAQHGAPAPVSERLPDCGFVAELDGVAVAAAWLYQDNSCGCAWLAHFVARPGCRVREAHRGFELLLGAADAVAEVLGRHTMVAAVASRGLGRILARGGWEPGMWNRHYWRTF